MTNFIHHEQELKKIKGSKKHKTPKKKVKRRKLFLKIFFVFFIFIFIAALFIFTNYDDAKAAYDSSLRGKQELLNAQTSIEAQNFTNARASLIEANVEFKNAKAHMDKLSEFKSIPLARKQITAVENILDSGIQLSSALEKVVGFADEILLTLQVDKGITINNISEEQKTQILKKMYEAPPSLQGAKAELDLAVLSMNRIPDSGLIAPIKKASQTVQQQLPLIKQIIDSVIPAIESIPPIVGYPGEKTYLFLLQNNTEMRPTGGFIGTYGMLKLENGNIRTFTTNNIYNLDNGVKNTLYVTPPWQFTQYMGTTQWFMRDSNWSPDFPTTAQKAEEFYALESSDDTSFDGVISVTPTFIQSLLKLTGPITAKGIEFTSENFIDVLEYQVEIAFAQQGLSDSQRKDVIGELADKLMQEIMDLPKERWPELWLTFQNDVNEKHILIYLKDKNLQSLVQEQKWSGDIRSSSGDFLMAVDTNLASLKSDPAVKRTINYTISEDSEHGLIGKVDIHYKHEGNFSWNSTRYRTYTRVYVPEGSELLSYSGVMKNDKLKGGGEGDVETLNEYGKTSFGGFIAIEPQTEGVLSYTYKLPENIVSDIRSKEYQLLVQKQSGALPYDLTITFDIGKTISSYQPLDTGEKEGDNKLMFSTDLDVDREFSLMVE